MDLMEVCPPIPGIREPRLVKAQLSEIDSFWFLFERGNGQMTLNSDHHMNSLGNYH